MASDGRKVGLLLCYTCRSDIKTALVLIEGEGVYLNQVWVLDWVYRAPSAVFVSIHLPDNSASPSSSNILSFGTTFLGSGLKNFLTLSCFPSSLSPKTFSVFFPPMRTACCRRQNSLSLRSLASRMVRSRAAPVSTMELPRSLMCCARASTSLLNSWISEDAGVGTGGGD